MGNRAFVLKSCLIFCLIPLLLVSPCEGLRAGVVGVEEKEAEDTTGSSIGSSSIPTPTIVYGSLKCSDTEFHCANKQHCVPSRWKCDGEHDCSDGSDELPLMCKNVMQPCHEHDFECTRTTCIPYAWVCDNSTDCPDAKDELNCTSNFTCNIDQFTCLEGTTKKCLPLTWVCDGTADCASGLDELNCNATCTTNEFTCHNGKCIVGSWRCDGNNDCSDNSDEAGCPPRTCTPGKDFMCKNDSSCILANWRCDGEYDCIDGSDEKGCNPEALQNLSSRCGKMEFECGDRITCIHNLWVCDGDADCPDGGDEALERCEINGGPSSSGKCRRDQFSCKNGECIPVHLYCSGTPECQDGSDEEEAACTEAAASRGCDPESQFTCTSTGSCISLDKVCNNLNDCGDWGDEPRDKCGVNECATGNGGCAELCVDTRLGHYCECKPGFKLVGNSSCDDIDECMTPGSCSQVCINEKGTYKCECVEGYLRDPKDHTKCKAIEGHASLLFALRRDIRKISLDHLKMTLIVEKTRSATALDYMFRTGMIFWSDGHEGKIYKAPIDEGEAKTVVVEDGLSNADGLAIDWVYNHIYWTDSGKKDIAVAELDGKMKKTIIKDGLVEPRAIAVNPVDGWMYWTDWGVTPGRIERSGMDGSRRETIVSTGLKWPNGLTLDLVQKRLYWVDAKMNSISSVAYDGSDRRLVLQSFTALAHPFSITTFEDYLYWTDWANETIFKANKFNGKELSAIIPPNTVKHVMSVHVYHAYRQPDGENHCTPLNGRCSHLCLPAPRVGDSPLISCACPDGLALAKDGLNCSPDPAFNLHHLLVGGEDGGWPGSSSSTNNASMNKTRGKLISKLSQKGMQHDGQKLIPKDQQTKSDFNPRVSSGGGGDPDTTTIAGIIIGILSALLVLVVLVVLVLYRHFFVKGGDSMNFDNPVYRKTTTEDRISIEKNRYKYPVSIPSSTVAESQPLSPPQSQPVPIPSHLQPMLANSMDCV